MRSYNFFQMVYTYNSCLSLYGLESLFIYLIPENFTSFCLFILFISMSDPLLYILVNFVIRVSIH